jgi:CHAT domain-containing protein
MFAWLRDRSQARGSAAAPALLGLADPAFRRPGEVPSGDLSPGDRDLTSLLDQTRGPVLLPLPGTRDELQAVARLFGRSETLLGAQASEQRLEELAREGRLAGFRYLHLATHGLLDEQVAMRSALVLSQAGLPDPAEQVLAGGPAYDGRLTAQQVFRTWKLDADLVTLSACRTGVAKQYVSGEGYLGFAQAFFVAGSRSLIVSQWEVSDEATALLMVRFYQNLLGSRPGLAPLSKVESLREAKDWLRRLTLDEADRELAQLRGEDQPPAAGGSSLPRYAHPFYWAGFILIGDPGEPSPPAPTPIRKGTFWPWVFGVAVVVLAVIGATLWWRRVKGRREPGPQWG